MPIEIEKPDLAVLETILQSPAVTSEDRTGLESYRKMVDPETGCVQVEYKLRDYGRYIGYAKRGRAKTYITGTSMKRVFRNLIFGEAYDDLDIENASGYIMCQLHDEDGVARVAVRHKARHRGEQAQLVRHRLGQAARGP